MQRLRRKLESHRERRKARKKAVQSSPEFLSPSPQLTTNSPVSRKQHLDVTTSEILSERDGGREESVAFNAVDENISSIHDTDREILTIIELPHVSKFLPSKIVEISLSVTPSTMASIDDNSDLYNLKLTQRELNTISKAFKVNFQKFIIKDTSLITFDAELQSALVASFSEDSIQLSTREFRQQLKKITQINVQRSEFASRKWYKKVGSFVMSLYPAVRMTLDVIANLTEIFATLHLV